MTLSTQSLIDVISDNVFSINCLKYLSLSDLCHLQILSKRIKKLCDHHIYLRFIYYDQALLPQSITGRFIWELYQMLKCIKSPLIKNHCFKYDPKSGCINPKEWFPISIIVYDNNYVNNSNKIELGLFYRKWQSRVNGYIRTSMIPTGINKITFYQHDDLILVTDNDECDTTKKSNLRHLICECPVIDLNGDNILNISQLPSSLEIVALIGNGIRSITDLKRIKHNLRCLKVSKNKLGYKLSDIQFNSDKLSNLCHIDFSYNKLYGIFGDLWTLSRLPYNLKHLDLSGNAQITGTLDFKIIPRTLEILYVSDCSITEIINIECLPCNVQKLNVSKNKIKMRIEDLINELPSENSNLISLNCSYNQMNGRLHLRYLPIQLQELDVSHNLCIHLVCMDFPNNLRSLNVSTTSYGARCVIDVV